MLTSTHAPKKKKPPPLKMNYHIQQWDFMIDSTKIFTVIFSSSVNFLDSWVGP